MTQLRNHMKSDKLELAYAKQIGVQEQIQLSRELHHARKDVMSLITKGGFCSDKLLKADRVMHRIATENLL